MGGKGSGGNNRLPTAIKKLRGNPGGRKLNEKEPKPEMKAPAMPPNLPDLAINEWNSIVPVLLRLGVLTELDGKALAAYCFSYARWQEAEKIVRERGMLIEEPIVSRETGEILSSKFKKNPMISVSSDALKMMKAYLAEFGLTPATRSKLKIEPPGEEDPFEAYLARKNSEAMKLN
jgi:P27 family predicted phage terminase small subunit